MMECAFHEWHHLSDEADCPRCKGIILIYKNNHDLYPLEIPHDWNARPKDYVPGGWE